MLYINMTSNDEVVNKFFYNGHGLGLIKIIGIDTQEEHRYVVQIPTKDIREQVWHVDEQGYAVNEDGVYLHDFIVKPKDDEYVIHKNGDIRNNKKTNLAIIKKDIIKK